MRDTPERDLVIAQELGHMADARIKELQAENERLKSALQQLRHHLQKQPDIVRFINAALGETK